MLILAGVVQIDSEWVIWSRSIQVQIFQMKVRSGPLLLLLGLGHSVNWCGMAMYQLVLGINGILFERIFRKVMLGNALQICTCSIT